KSFTWYLRMFQYGMPPHAGFGLGFERLVRWVANLPHIREATMFPRTPEICTP
ncbi:MAG: amino acid--tRNA ligase-related protein, partial [Candidatus Hodarchaeales archaeon]